MLTTDPYVRVNHGASKRLTKEPVSFDLPPGPVTIEVALSRSGFAHPEAPLFNPIARHDVHLDHDDTLRLWFHPAYLNSALRSGRIGQE